MSIHVATDDEAKKIVSAHGHHAEHNFYHFLNMRNMFDSGVFPVFEGKYGIMAFWDKDSLWCYSDPVAPEDKCLEIFMEFLEWGFGQGAKKVRAEISETLWRAVTKEIAANGYRAIKPSYVYVWPVFDLRKWDPKLSGTIFKKLRNIKNSFQHKNIRILQKDDISKNDLLEMIKRWKKLRQGNDRTHMEHYASSVETGFIGYDSVRIIEIDGQVRGINGGWKIPNNKSFYSQLGLHDYSLPNLGDFCYIEDLTFLKTAGYDFADFGGSTPEMMRFKRKFMPAYEYKTVEFSTVKK